MPLSARRNPTAANLVSADSLFTPSGAGVGASDHSPNARNVVAVSADDRRPMPVPNVMQIRLRELMAELVRLRVSSPAWRSARLTFAETARDVVRQVFGIDLTVEECHTRVAFDHGFTGVYRPVIEEVAP